MNNYSILFIEDSEADYAIVQALLKSVQNRTYSIRWISDFKEAEREIELESASYDAVIIDYMLGANCGLDLVKKMRHGLSPPIIMLTGIQNSNIDEEAQRLGVKDFISKNNLNSELIDRSIRYAIEHWKNEKLLIRQQREIATMLKMSALGEMASTITHEINNPLSVIQANISALEIILSKDQPDKLKIQKYLNSIQIMVQRIIAIKEGLKNHYGTFKKKLVENVDLNKIILEAIQLCKPSSTNHAVSIEFTPQESITIQANPTELSQVFVNLLTNSIDAIKALTERWISVEVDQKQTTIDIKVTDSGLGIPQDLQQKLFIKNFSTKKKGMGIGLNFSRNIVLSHGGRLTLNPNGPHTQFLIQLPLNQNLQEKAQTRFAAIDDKLDTLDVLKDGFQSRGLEVDVYSDPLSALSEILQKNYDVVITDVHMPKMSGLELEKEVLSKKPEQAPDFIFITGFDDAETRLHLSKNKNSTIFEKPFNVAKLVDHAITKAELRKTHTSSLNR